MVRVPHVFVCILAITCGASCKEPVCVDCDDDSGGASQLNVGGGGSGAAGGNGGSGGQGEGGEAVACPTPILPDSTARCFHETGSIDCNDEDAVHQDGALVQPAPSYVLSPDDEGYLDELTQLTWRHQLLLDQPLDEGACAAAFGNAWRLPSRFELVTIIDPGRAAPAADIVSFPGVHIVWTASRVEESVIAVDFADGTPKTYGSAELFAMRCVKGASRQQELSLLDGAVFDASTGLTWSSTAEIADTWQDAAEMCEARPQTGCRPWRLPTAKELLTLLDDKDRLDPAFGDSPDAFALSAWSATPMATAPGRVWVLHMGKLELGTLGFEQDARGLAHVRCVW